MEKQEQKDWIIKLFDDYSDDYKFMKKNWTFLCDKLNTKPNKIVMVRYLPVAIQNDNDKRLTVICDNMIKDGHTIRREGELVECKVCGKAIPSKHIYDLLKKNVDDRNRNRKENEQLIWIPNKWSNYCKKCKK